MGLISFTNPLVDNLQAAATFATKIPAGISVRSGEHLAQIHENRRFQDYDFGPEGNMARYGSLTPPLFDVSQISDIPIAMLIAGLDDEENPVDDRWLSIEIEDVLVFNNVYQNFSHFDFYVAENTEVYLQDIIDLLDEYDN